MSTETINEILKELGLITDEMMGELTGTTEGTRETWARRGLGPPRIRMGNRYYYHTEAGRAYIDMLVQDRVEKHAELSVTDVPLQPLTRSWRKKGAA